ncbi:uncharacterized protein LOC113006235 isoform X2 [Solenopsis invicta]|uniref:uncharacterized protein LOC113006235 isoform X2 n=1 Tax=Solenopsis invicta TaxID=13686 RepID=UPI00193D2E30|nr:uncharacterized protein LOC113006235 isoform X2 [Solenopsis invicta]
MRIRSFTYMRIDRPRSARGFAFRLNLIFFSCPFINFYCVVFVTPYPTRVDKIFLCNSCATGIDTVQLIPVQFGTGKPKPLDLYLHEFLCELNVLSTNGFFYNGQQIKIKLNAFICDAPARAYLKCCTSHNEICIVWLNLLKLQRRKLYQQNGLINKVLSVFGLITKAPTELKKLFYQAKFLIQRSGTSMIPEYYINIIHIKKLALTYQKLYIHLIWIRKKIMNVDVKEKEYRKLGLRVKKVLF